jgi:hypothetical protein
MLLTLLIVAGTVRGQTTNIIYQDNFARTGVLSGSAPDTVNAPGATWFACDNPAINAVLMTDGSEIDCTNFPNPTNGIYLNGFLPFTPQVGHIYTLSCQMVALSGGAQWLAMGFATQPITNNFYAAVNCGAGFILVRGNGSGIQAYESPGGGSTATVNANFGTTTNVFTVVLNTATNGIVPVNADYGWVYTFYTNGVMVATYRVPYGNPPIQYVGIGADSATGYFQQFKLVDVVVNPSAPIISEQPNNRTAQVGQRSTFWVGVTNDYPSASYQWMTNSSSGITNAIVGATNAAYTTPALDMTYNGLNYSVAIANVYGATNSALASLTVGSGPPTLYSAVKTANRTNIIVAFSKPVDPVTGLNPANYSLNVNGAPAGVSVVSANYGALSNSVVLTTSMLDTNAGYYLTVQNVKDMFGNAMSSAIVPLLPNGLVFYVRADSGVVLDSSGNVVEWLDQTTNGNDAAQFFGVPSAGASYISTVVRPTTDAFNNGQPAVDFGSTIHWLQAPNSPSLASMISNTTMYAVAKFSAGSDDFVNKTLGNLPAPFDWDPNTGENIQYGNGFNNAPANGTGNTLSLGVPYVLASTITLPVAAGGTTNFNFYLNGNGNGSGAIRAVTGNPPGIYDFGEPLWIGARSDLVNPRMKGQLAEILLFNNNISDEDRTNLDNYLGAKYFPIAITQNLPATTTSSNGFSVTYTFTAGQGSVHGFFIQWQENGTNIPGAMGPTYTTALLGPGDNGDKFVAVLTRPDGSIIDSVTNTLTVVPAAPYVTAAGIPLWESANSTNIIVLFDEAVDPATATVAGNYSLNGASVLSATMGSEPSKVVLTTSTLAQWSANPGTYSLQVQNVKDFYGLTIATASTSIGIYPAATVLWLESNKGVVTDAGANTVNEWDDQSGLADNLYQFDGVLEEPFLTTNANSHGLPAIQFVGTNTQVLGGNAFTTFLASTPPAGGNDYPPLEITNDMSAFVVVNFSTLAGGTNGEIFSKLGAGGASNHQPAPYDYYVANASQTVFLRGNGTANSSFVSTNGPSVGAPHILAVNEMGGFVSQYLDTANVGTNTLSLNALDAGQAFQIGERNDFVNRLNGYMSEVILVSSGLDTNDVAAIQNYLAAKYLIPTGTNSFPLITQEPVASTNIDLGTTLVVPAGVSGNPLALQWYDTNGVAIAGQISSTLNIQNDQSSDAYYLVVTNQFGASTSSVVSVTVYSGLTVFLGPPSVSLYVGEPYTFTAQAFGNVPLQYQWYQGASPIPNATNATYSTVASLGATSYTCTVTNGYNGYTSTNAGPVTLTGLAQPTNGFSQAILSDHPIAYWRLNEPSGSAIAYDYVGGYNGTYGSDTTNGLPGVPFAGASGELGVAMNSSDSSSNAIGHVSTPGINLITNSVTLVCWVYSFANQLNPSGVVFLRDSSNANVFGSQVGGGQTFDYTWGNNSATYDYASPLVVPINTWCLTALAITPSNATLYLFDSQASGSAVNGVTNALQSFAAGFALGADNQAITSNRTFNGKMDEVAVFNYTMSASQLQQLYTAATTVPIIVNPNPTNIVFSVANSQLTLNWPADHTGWQLQAQTNSLSVGISTNWVNVGGTTVTNKLIIPINLTKGTVFYRLVYP